MSKKKHHSTFGAEHSWSAHRAVHRPDEKHRIARYFADHDFLVVEGSDPETNSRESVASILVNQGTTPNVVVDEALNWIEAHPNRGPFFLTWYTPGHLVPATLRSYRLSAPHLSSSTKLFLFSGLVDPETEAVSGPDAEEFAERLYRHFSYSILSAYSFDICTGTAYFHMPGELRLQRACATRYASRKFLFLDSTKFKTEGEVGYGIRDLLATTTAVVIYTNTSTKDPWLTDRFEELCNEVLDNSEPNLDLQPTDTKTLVLKIVGHLDVPTVSIAKRGLLRST
jgi:hypothetical protein